MPVAIPSALPRWASLDAWQATTFYAVGERVTNDGGKLYTCVTEGTSAGAGGPTGAGAGIVDGSAVWDYVSENAPAWGPLTAYAAGDRVTNDGGKVYQCIVAGTSGALPGPTGTAGTTPPNPAIIDDAVQWIYTADSEAQITTPSAGQLDTGWIPGQRPPAQFLNWFMWTVYRWLLWLKQYTGEIIWAARTDRTNTFTEPQIIDADPELAGMATALIDLQTTAVDFAKLIQISEQAAGAIKARWYVTTGGGLVFTMNAQWDPVGLVWLSDNNAAAAQRWRWGAAETYVDTHAAAVSWADGAWSSARLSFDPITGDLTVVGTSAGLKLKANSTIASATGGVGQAVALGEVWADTPLRAWARAKMTAGPTWSIEWSMNLASVTYVAAGKYRFTLQSGAAAATKLVPTATVCAASPYIYTIPPSTITATVFEVWTYDLAGVLTDLANDDLITVHVAAT